MAVADGAIAGPDDRDRPQPRRRAGPAPSGGAGALLRLPREVLWQRLGYRLRAPWFASAVYRLTLPARPDGSVALGFPDPWPGNAALGGALIQGTFALADETIRNPAPLWAPIGADPAWLEELHGFAWLRDLRAVGGDTGRRAARDLVGSWIDDNARWRPLPWRPDLIGQRLAAWIAQYDFFGASGDAGLRGRLLVSAARQACHLARVLPAGLTGGALIVAIKGLIYAGLALPRGEAWLARGLVLLETELARQIGADGGHVERSPSAHLAVLRHLIDLRAALDTAGRPLPSGLPAAIDGLASMLRLFQHGDGGLALFNDSNEEESWQIDMALGRADAHARPLVSAPQSGFQRLVANRTVVLVDSGAPAPPGFDAHAHAGTLSFEMSVGRERLIVNCGARASGAEWRLAQRSTAAHSTLVVDDTNSSELLAGGGLARRPRAVTCRREESDGNIWLDLGHDGYAAPFGLAHRRRLYLAASGDELRGEDRLTRSGRRGRGRPFELRFHLHPQVQAFIAQNGQAAILRLAGGSGWRLRAAGVGMALDDSVYLGRRGQVRRTQQIVLAGVADEDETAVKWALARESRRR